MRHCRRPDRHALDLDHLDRQTQGDDGLQRELLGLFVQQCERLMPVIAGEPSALARADAAHALKGAALAIGARKVAALCDILETATDLEAPQDIHDEVVRLLGAEVAGVERAIAQRRNSAA